MRTICKSLQDIKKGLEKLTDPDVIFEWYERGKVYVAIATSEKGKKWLERRSNAENVNGGRLVNIKHIEQWVKDAKNSRLNIKIEE